MRSSQTVKQKGRESSKEGGEMGFAQPNSWNMTPPTFMHCDPGKAGRTMALGASTAPDYL